MPRAWREGSGVYMTRATVAVALGFDLNLAKASDAGSYRGG